MFCTKAHYSFIFNYRGIGEDLSFPKRGKSFTLTTKDRKVTYSNPSIKLWIEKKSATKLKSVKSHEEDFVFLVVKTHKSFPKGSKGYSQ